MSVSYKNGKIFCIKNTVDDEVFIGATQRWLDDKMKEYKSMYNKEKGAKMQLCQHMMKHGIDNFYIELLENAECSSIDEMKQKVKAYTKKLGTLNKRIEGRTKEEWKEDNPTYSKEYKDKNKEKIKLQRQLWYQENKDHCLEKHVQWRTQNKEHLQTYAKQYQQDNKDKLAEHRHEIIQCECGACISRHSKSRHSKTQGHLIRMSQLSMF